jgi:hypothetical protein
MEDNSAAEINEETAGIFVDSDKENAVRRGGETDDVGGSLTWKSDGFGFDEVCDGDSVTDW